MHTKTGAIKVELVAFDTQQVNHVENFLKHCAKGTYNNNFLLRYIPEFILQTGDPENTGKSSNASDTANNDERNIDRYFTLGEKPQAKRGSVFMLNNKDNEGLLGSQFFFSLSEKYKDTLNSTDYTLIGGVIDGYSALEAIEQAEELNDPQKMKKNGKVRGKWKKEIWLTHVEIHYNPFA